MSWQTFSSSSAPRATSHARSSIQRSITWFIGGLTGAGLHRGVRVVVEKPFGRDFASAHELNTSLHGACKPRILAAVRDRLGDRVTTLHVCQGKHAHAEEHARFADADRTIDAITDILDLDLATLQEDRP